MTFCCHAVVLNTVSEKAHSAIYVLATNYQFQSKSIIFMGSYISIVNDTHDLWMCKVGLDDSVLNNVDAILSVLNSVFHAVGPTLASTAAPVTTSVANGVVSVSGVPTSALAISTTGAATATAVANVAGAVSGFGFAMVQGLSDKLKKRSGYKPIPAGQQHKWGKMTLSLWQQGSGATKVSTKSYKIRSWINKAGTDKVDVVVHNSHRMLRDQGQDTMEENEIETEKLFYFNANGTETGENLANRCYAAGDRYAISFIAYNS